MGIAIGFVIYGLRVQRLSKATDDGYLRFQMECQGLCQGEHDIRLSLECQRLHEGEHDIQPQLGHQRPNEIMPGMKKKQESIVTPRHYLGVRCCYEIVFLIYYLEISFSALEQRAGVFM